jgi:ABC-type uncharacterized transport system YnjBCD permease subunit
MIHPIQELSGQTLSVFVASSPQSYMLGTKHREEAAMFALIIAAILYFSLMYVCGRYTAKYAALRGRSEAVWFVLGCLFYPVPYIVLALLPPHRKENAA